MHLLYNYLRIFFFQSLVPVKRIKIVTIIINEVRLNIKLKLFLIKTPSIKIEKTAKDKKDFRKQYV